MRTITDTRANFAAARLVSSILESFCDWDCAVVPASNRAPHRSTSFCRLTVALAFTPLPRNWQRTSAATGPELHHVGGQIRPRSWLQGVWTIEWCTVLSPPKRDFARPWTPGGSANKSREQVYGVRHIVGGLQAPVSYCIGTFKVSTNFDSISVCAIASLSIASI